MTRLIDVNALKTEIEEELPLIHLGPFGYVACSPKTEGELVHKREYVLRVVDSAPTVDAVEVVHGRWIEKYDKVSWHEDDVERFFECSICGCISGYDSPYCPNCGAKMDLEVKDG